MLFTRHLLLLLFLRTPGAAIFIRNLLGDSSKVVEQKCVWFFILYHHQYILKHPVCIHRLIVRMLWQRLYLFSPVSFGYSGPHLIPSIHIPVPLDYSALHFLHPFFTSIYPFCLIFHSYTPSLIPPSERRRVRSLFFSFSFRFLIRTIPLL